MSKRTSEETEGQAKKVKLLEDSTKNNDRDLFLYDTLDLEDDATWPAEGQPLDNITCALLALNTTVRERRKDDEDKPK